MSWVLILLSRQKRARTTHIEEVRTTEQITLYKNFSKRHNSTKRPTGGTTVDVTLKNDTSVESPTFIIQGIDLSYNYVKWRDHYYFINDIRVLNANLCELNCSQDELATYKDYIGETTTYIERADDMVVSSYSNDEYIPQLQRFVQTTKRTTSLSNIELDGCYTMRVVSKTGLKTFVLTSAELNSVLSFAFSDNVWDFIADKFASGVYNPFSKIVSVKWFPFSKNVFRIASGQGGYVTESVTLGFYDTGVLANVCNDGIRQTGTINLPTLSYQDYRNYSSAWTTLTAYLPGCGAVELDSINMIKGITYELYVDAITGQCQYNLYHKDDNANETGLITSISGMLGTDIQISADTSDAVTFTTGSVGGLVSLVGGVASGNIANAVGGASGIASSVTALTRGNTSSIGSNGNVTVLRYYNQIVVTVAQLNASDRPSDVLGKPIDAIRPIKIFSGYVKCKNASVELPSLSADRETVNNYLNSGFYFE